MSLLTLPDPSISWGGVSTSDGCLSTKVRQPSEPPRRPVAAKGLEGKASVALGGSGIYLQDQGRISNEYAQQQALEEAENASRMRAIQDALVALGQQLGQDRVAIIQDVAGVGLDEAYRLAAELALD